MSPTFNPMIYTSFTASSSCLKDPTGGRSIMDDGAPHQAGHRRPFTDSQPGLQRSDPGERRRGLSVSPDRMGKSSLLCVFVCLIRL